MTEVTSVLRFLIMDLTEVDCMWCQTVEPLISHRFTREQLPECYRRLDQGAKDIVGAVFNW
jgi:hypothetical protein